jgi:hypothetical protein
MVKSDLMETYAIKDSSSSKKGAKKNSKKKKLLIKEISSRCDFL